MIVCWGAPNSSAGRTHWLLEELGVPYEYRRVQFAEKPADFLAVSPGGKVPALKDGDIELFESMAINGYLAEKYGPELAGRDNAERARIWQWSLWSIAKPCASSQAIARSAWASMISGSAAASREICEPAK